MSLIHILVDPHCPSTLLASASGPHWKWIEVLRPTLNITRKDIDTFNTIRPLTGLVTEWTYAFSMELVIRRRRGMTGSIISDIVDHRHVIPTVVMENYEYYGIPWLLTLVLTILTGVFLLEYLPRPARQSYRQVAKRALLFGISLFGMVLLLPPGIVLILIIGLDFLTFSLQSGSMLLVLMKKPWRSESYPGAVYNPSNSLNLYPDWQMIWTYGHTPQSYPCPKAWKDPTAGYVWWLA